MIEDNDVVCILGRYDEAVLLCSVTDALLYQLTLRTRKGVQQFLGQLVKQYGEADRILGAVPDEGSIQQTSVLSMVVSEAAKAPSEHAKDGVYQLRTL